ncbi:MAG: hypothetical protein AAF266_03570 [Planctomycetota bacterium]
MIPPDGRLAIDSFAKRGVISMNTRLAVDRSRRAIPSWLLGAMAGVAVWLAAFTVFALLFFTDILRSLPDWLLESPFVGTVVNACVILSSPIAMGGWFFVWGDNGPPQRWMDNPALNYAIGITCCAMMGAAFGYTIGLGTGRFASHGSAESDRLRDE